MRRHRLAYLLGCCASMLSCHSPTHPILATPPRCDITQLRLTLLGIEAAGMMKHDSRYQLSNTASLPCQLPITLTVWSHQSGRHWQTIPTPTFQPHHSSSYTLSHTQALVFTLNSTGPTIEPGDPGYRTPFNAIAVSLTHEHRHTVTAPFTSTYTNRPRITSHTLSQRSAT